MQIYAEQENELKNKAIFDFNNNNSNTDYNELENNNNYSNLYPHEYNNKYDNHNNLNSNLDGSFGISGNSFLTSNNPPLNLHNRMISDNSNFNLNNLADKNNKEIILEKQSGISENNIFLNNLNKNNNSNINSSRNDFVKDEKILSFLLSVVDSNFCFRIFKKFNLNFYDFLNVTKDELTEFKIPIKEKIRVLKLNINLKKFLEENTKEDGFIAFTQNISEVNNLNLIIEFFKENKFLVYNQKFLDGFVNENYCLHNKTEEECLKDYLNNPNSHGKYSSVDNIMNTDDDKNFESDYITTPNFRNVSYRKSNRNIINNNASSSKNNMIGNNFNIEELNNQTNENANYNENNKFHYKPKSNTIFDNYNCNPNRNVIYNSNSNNSPHMGSHEKEIIELLKNKEIKNNRTSGEPAYSAKKAILQQSNTAINLNKNMDNKENSHYESFRNEYDKIKDLNENYKNCYSNSNSYIGNKLSEFSNDPCSKTLLNDKNSIFNESGNTFTNKIGNAANSSIKMNNYESNKDATSFKISNFSIKSNNNFNNNNNNKNIICYNNPNNNNYNENNNEEYEIGYAEQEENQLLDNNSKYLNEEFLKKPQIKSAKGLYNNQSAGTIQLKNYEVIENHESLQNQKKLLDKLIENKTKSKIKFKKSSTHYTNNSNEIGKVVNNYLSEYKELKQRSENRQMKFNRLLKNCNRMHNNKSSLEPIYNIEAGNITEKTNTNDREELLLNKELNDLLNELQIYSENFKVSEENIPKLKQIKNIIDALKAKNINVEFDFDFNVEELEKQIVNLNFFVINNLNEIINLI